MKLFPSLLELPNLGKSISDNPYRKGDRRRVARGQGGLFPYKRNRIIGNIFATLFWYWQLKKWGVQCIYDTAAEKNNN